MCCACMSQSYSVKVTTQRICFILLLCQLMLLLLKQAISVSALLLLHTSCVCPLALPVHAFVLTEILSTNSMEHSLYREVNSSIDSQKSSAICRIYRFNTMFARACHSSCLEQEEPRPHHLSLRYSVILSLHLHLGHPGCFFLDKFMYTVCKFREIACKILVLTCGHIILGVQYVCSVVN